MRALLCYLAYTAALGGVLMGAAWVADNHGWLLGGVVLLAGFALLDEVLK